jgi:hypothetical protein
MGRHVLEHVRRRLKGLLAHLIQADSMPALFAGHDSARGFPDGYVHVHQHTLPSCPVRSIMVRIGPATPGPSMLESKVIVASAWENLSSVV